jgi:hypothetical protein
VRAIIQIIQGKQGQQGKHSRYDGEYTQEKDMQVWTQGSDIYTVPAAVKHGEDAGFDILAVEKLGIRREFGMQNRPGTGARAIARAVSGQLLLGEGNTPDSNYGVLYSDFRLAAQYSV